MSPRKQTVRFLSNLGRKDAQVLGADFLDCTCGATLEVGEQDVRWLMAKGIVEIVETAPPKEIKAVPDEPAIGSKNTSEELVEKMSEATPRKYKRQAKK